MDTRAFYGARKVTHVSTLAEVNEFMENAKNVFNVVVFLSDIGDSGSRVSDAEDFADNMEEIFDPAG